MRVSYNTSVINVMFVVVGANEETSNPEPHMMHKRILQAKPNLKTTL
jgi:hypothetical protein